jgi:hypothetical protein
MKYMEAILHTSNQDNKLNCLISISTVENRTLLYIMSKALSMLCSNAFTFSFCRAMKCNLNCDQLPHQFKIFF